MTSFLRRFGIPVFLRDLQKTEVSELKTTLEKLQPKDHVTIAVDKELNTLLQQLAANQKQVDISMKEVAAAINKIKSPEAVTIKADEKLIATLNQVVKQGEASKSVGSGEQSTSWSKLLSVAVAGTGGGVAYQSQTDTNKKIATDIAAKESSQEIVKARKQFLRALKDNCKKAKKQGMLYGYTGDCSKKDIVEWLKEEKETVKSTHTLQGTTNFMVDNNFSDSLDQVLAHGSMKLAAHAKGVLDRDAVSKDAVNEFQHIVLAAYEIKQLAEEDNLYSISGLKKTAKAAKKILDIPNEATHETIMRVLKYRMDKTYVIAGEISYAALVACCQFITSIQEQVAAMIPEKKEEEEVKEENTTPLTTTNETSEASATPASA
eukprot:m.2954 g.2954  ORF g.2954 m.2954 type:complete len:377 (+) comp2632_c0_seq1:103-1233(+)